MFLGKKVIVVLPAYNAQATLARTLKDIPPGIADDILLVDDASSDRTVDTARQLGLNVYTHPRNLGYGANRKTCYTELLRHGADIIVMLHPDYQYDPRLVPAMASMIASGVYDVVLGSRILGNTTRSGGMPRYKYVANRALTFFQNLMLGSKLSEFHTGYRAFSRNVLESLPLLANSDDFVFDNQMLAQAIAFRFNVGEISCPTRYFQEASSINFRRSVVYGLGVLRVSMTYRLWRWGLVGSRTFSKSPTMRHGREHYTASLNTTDQRRSDAADRH